MIEDHYDYLSFNNKTQFFFQSLGSKGLVVKAVVFSRVEGNRWNVGFGDLRDGKIDDISFTNNSDVYKVISTVVQAIYDFSDAHPERIITINPVDERRRRFYNAVFKRHLLAASEVFDVLGIVDENSENYSPEKEYDSFELKRKFGA